VTIRDHGEYELEKWRDDELIVSLHGEADAGLGGTARFALIRTKDGRGRADNWLIHRMKPTGAAGNSRTNARPAAAHSAHTPSKNAYSAMLAVAGSEPELDDAAWALEIKWDGMRAVEYGQDLLVRRGIGRKTRLQNHVR
jgi:bifunctional non-homologous end joining protein LigD